MKNWLIFFILLLAIGSEGQRLPSNRHPFAVSPKGGFFSEPVQISIDAPDSVKVYYTLDGNVPTRRKNRYKGPINISKTATLRVMAVFPDKVRRYRAYTYFVDEPESTIPVLSIALPPKIFFDPEKGLYIEGPNKKENAAYRNGSNYWSQREIPVHFEFYEPNGLEGFNGLVGLRIFGGISRTFPQKSFAIVARKKYGKSRINHPVFGEEGFNKYKYLVLRNSGSDWGKSHLRDGFMTTLVEDWDIAKQDYRPAHVYMNGKYWGMYNIREKINRTFVGQHFDIDKDQLDLIEHRTTVKRGSSKEYRKLLNYLESHDLTDDKVFAEVKKMMDINNFLDYQIAQIYFDNTDAGGNIKFWRARTPTGKWRWILYDTDWGFGLNNRKAYRKNTLKMFTADDGPEWPNPPWSTFILRKLLTNKSFEQKFINRFADRLNTTLEPNHVLALLDTMVGDIQPEISRQNKRWKIRNSTWNREVATIKTFAQKRPRYIRRHLEWMFKVGDTTRVQLMSGPGGKIVLNDLIEVKDGQPFQGAYFSDTPIKISAIADKGFHFVGWEGLNTEHHAFRVAPKKLTKKLKARFEKFVHPLTNTLVINEISANNYFAGDWVELLNNSKEPIRLDGFIIRDKKNEFTLPPIELDKNELIVICEDSTAFRKFFPDYEGQLIGNLGFGLNKHKEKVSIYSADYATIDEFNYQVEPKDQFQTISLLTPGLNNARQENWEVLDGNGTPGAMNPYYVLSKIHAAQELYVRIGLIIGVVLILLLVLYLKHSDGQYPAWAQRWIQIAKDRLVSIQAKW